MQMQKFINDPVDVVADMLRGMAAAHADLIRVLDDTWVVVRADAPVRDKVGLVTGGGSGHEPTHAGYVGPGMLDAACVGNVFSSPPADQMFRAIQAVDSGRGVLCIIKNYTGDILNFEIAQEMAAEQGIETSRVIVNDDVAVRDSTYTTGRRGVAGTVFVHKIVGAKAARGAPLAEVLITAQRVVDQVRTMGVALSPCTIPSVGKPNFTLKVGDMEVGIGIHGEPGVERRAIASAEMVADTLVGRVVNDLPFRPGDEVVVMVNGMGATPLMELYIVYSAAAEIMRALGLRVHRVWVGEYMTSLEMAGLSFTLLRLDPELRDLLDAPCRTAGLVQAGTDGR